MYVVCAGNANNTLLALRMDSLWKHGCCLEIGEAVFGMPFAEAFAAFKGVGVALFFAEMAVSYRGDVDAFEGRVSA